MASERTTNATVIGLVVLVIVLLGALTWSVLRPLPVPLAPPSHADVFDQVAASVVAVSVEQPARVGSGFAISDNEVVTARHLVVDVGEVTVRDVSGRPLRAEVIGTDARADLALLRVEEGGLQPTVLGNTERLRVGDTVLAIGNPFGLGHSRSVGGVGHRGRRLAAGVADLPQSPIRSVRSAKQCR